MGRSHRRGRKQKLVLCRGCNKCFGEGRGLTLHHTNSPACAQMHHSRHLCSSAATPSAGDASVPPTSLPPAVSSPPSTPPAVHRATSPAAMGHFASTSSHPPSPAWFPEAEAIDDFVASGDSDALPADSDDTPSDASESSGPPIHRDFVQMHEDHRTSGFGDIPMDPDLQTKVELMVLLREASAPHNLLDKIWKWARSSVLRGVNFQTSFSREQVVKKLKKRCGETGCGDPIFEKVNLPASGLSASIVKFDFLGQMHSLLSDPDNMRDNNLIFHQNNPFAPPPLLHDNCALQDTNDGSVYKEAHRLHVKVPFRDVTCLIVLFLDKTHVDRLGRTTIEPVSFTLGIFNKKTRRHFRAWRTLGFICNFSHLKITDPDVRASDCHFVLGKILQPLVDAQGKGGIAWNLECKNEVYPVVFKIPVACVLGDTEGHDNLTGHCLNKTVTKRICRHCNCPRQKIRNPVQWEQSKHQHHCAPHIQKLVERKDIDALRDLCFRLLKNAFSPVQFADVKRGTNGATVVELLHLIQHGLFLCARDGFFGQRKVRKVSSKKRKRVPDHPNDPSDDAVEEDRDDDSCDVAPSDQEVEDSPDDSADDDFDDDFDEMGECLFGPDGCLEDFALPPNLRQDSKHYVFSAQLKQEVDRMCQIYGRMLCHQSDREWDRAYFANGVTGDAKKNGHEERCVIMLLLILLCSPFGAKVIDKKMTSHRSSTFVMAFSHLLMLEEFMRRDSIVKKHVKMLNEHIPIFLSIFKQAIQRTAGKGMDFVKFHHPIHIPADTLRFGPPTVTDSSHGEKHHMEHKDLARRTQLNSSTFEKQLSLQEQAARLVDRAHRELRGPPKDPPLASDTVSYCGNNYFVSKKGLFHQRQVHRKKPAKVARWCNRQLDSNFNRFFREEMFPLTDDENIPLFTQATVDGCLCRADPGTRMEHGRGRHDWVNINWGSEIVPARIIVYFRVKTVRTGAPLSNGTESFQEPGLCAVVCSLHEGLCDEPTNSNDKNYKAHQCTNLIYYSKLETEDVMLPNSKATVELPMLHVVPVTPATFDSPVIAVPCDVDDRENEFAWLFVEPRQNYVQTFEDTMQDVIDLVREQNS